MKFSLSLTIGILALAAVWGVRSERHHADLLANYERLAAEAQALGFDPEAASAPRTRSRPRSGAPGSGGESPRDAREVAAELVSIIARWDGSRPERGRTPQHREMQAKVLGLLGDVAEFDDLELKILVDELRNSMELEIEPARHLVNTLLTLLGSERPAAALTLLHLADDLAGPGRRKDNIMSSILADWASRDPSAALEWLRDHDLAKNQRATDATLSDLLQGVARTDPRLAFSLADELGTGDDGHASRLIHAAMQNPDSRLELFNVLRERMAVDGATERDISSWQLALMSLGPYASREDVDSATALLESIGLRSDERVSFIDSLAQYKKRPDFGRWLEWGAAAATDEAQRASISSSFARWVAQDLIASAEWLDQTSPGPLRDSALEAYVRTTAARRPDLAAARLADLPAGETRDHLTRQVHAYMRFRDPAAAADFATRHGLAP